ncbi:hypothetical protein OG242_31730 [Streptomyces sp. NBC_00727]|uniref:hypothetical protein n=1 Tax=Streptomyces sp. NBC_00727 TaxID=2903675 RepID=UPI003864BB22
MTFPPVEISTVCLHPSSSHPSIATELTTLLFDGGGPGTAEHDAAMARKTLCVAIVGADGVDDLLPHALDWTRRGGLLLPVVVDARHTSVGPLTNPGFSACLQCACYSGLLDPEPAPAGADGPGDPADVPWLVAKLVAVTVAREVHRITRDTKALPMTLGALARIDHASGTVGFRNAGQIDGCETCSALLESVFQGSAR